MKLEPLQNISSIKHPGQTFFAQKNYCAEVPHAELCWYVLCGLAYNAELQLKRLKHTLPLHLPFSIKLSVKMLYTKGSLWFNIPSLRYHWKWPHWFERSLQEAFCCKHGWAELWATLVSWWGLCPAHWEVGSRDWHCISAVCPVLRLCRKWQGPKLCFT